MPGPPGPPGRPAAPGPLLRHVAAAGPYFAVSTAPPPPAALPLEEVYAAGADGPLGPAVRTVAARLGTEQTRVAASTLHLGITARLWSVALGAAVLGGVVLDLAPARVHVVLPETGPIALWLPDPLVRTIPDVASDETVPGDPGDPAGDRLRDPARGAARALEQVVAQDHLVPLARAVRTVTPIAPGLLRGNAASALVGAARVLHARTGGRAPAAFTLTGLLLERGYLRGAGAWRAEPPAFTRNSCCLYYRAAPGGGLCGDCVFTTPPGHRDGTGRAHRARPSPPADAGGPSR